MYDLSAPHQTKPSPFPVAPYALPYSSFMPKLYNWCQSLGFSAGKIMPSRAFCSDESQGYPILLMTQHFGTFPFDHGRVGGIMSTGRHGPHAAHGKDLVIVQASHVGYLPERDVFGEYSRWQTEPAGCSTNCGKIHGVLAPYLRAYQRACQDIQVEMTTTGCQLTLDKQYLSTDNTEPQLVLDLGQMLTTQSDSQITALTLPNSAQTFEASAGFRQHLQAFIDPAAGRQRIGAALKPEFFSYRHAALAADKTGVHQLELNLLDAMPWIVSSASPMLTAAQVNTQAEFDRAWRSIVQEPAYQGKNLLYLAGLHIDVSPPPEQRYPLTQFVPWAAYQQLSKGAQLILEQAELFAALQAAKSDNPDQINLDALPHP